LIPTLISIVLAGSLALAQEQQTNPPAAQTAPVLTIEETVICTGIADRVPQGLLQAGQLTAPPSTTAGGGGDPFPFKLYAFTKISGGAPATIKHAWYYQDKLVRTIELSVGGTPWRTWSQKEIQPKMIGLWKLEVQDSSGAVLKIINFAVNEKGESELK
jgi:hypothetical protein